MTRLTGTLVALLLCGCDARSSLLAAVESRGDGPARDGRPSLDLPRGREPRPALPDAPRLCSKQARADQPDREPLY